jgi:hypothetical protein
VCGGADAVPAHLESSKDIAKSITLQVIKTAGSGVVAGARKSGVWKKQAPCATVWSKEEVRHEPG